MISPASRFYAADMPQRFPRPLTPREAEVLPHLLSADSPGREALSAQTGALEVVGRWGDAPTVELHVSDPLAPLARVENDPPVEASTPDALYSVVLFVQDGLVTLMELVDNSGKGTLTELPAAADLRPADALGPTAARSW
jgi:hypothetical protein